MWAGQQALSAPFLVFRGFGGVAWSVHSMHITLVRLQPFLIFLSRDAPLQVDSSRF